VQTFISSYGYLAVFILMLAESACIPIPSELTMPLAGALSAGAVAGTHMNLVLAIAAGVAGNVAGSYLAWGVGAYGGRAAWHRWGRYILLRDDDIDRAERWFGRHGGKAVFFGRLLPAVRTFISLPAGLARMPPVRFGIYTLLGCIPWTTALALAGYLVGKNWENVASALRGPSLVLGALLVLLVIVAIVMLWRRRRRERGEDSVRGEHRGPACAGRAGRVRRHGVSIAPRYTSLPAVRRGYCPPSSPAASPESVPSLPVAPGSCGSPVAGPDMDRSCSAPGWIADPVAVISSGGPGAGSRPGSEE
jgi:membrane protein DedA with SNARE-associated domain